ncbi:hypothetical protein K435DRAFT_768161 [Dendrothele bispora CBS 962.96]|uniref:Mnn4-regulates the mannosylphosphorylation n=1 Tax=Dendrothele bispora (strain CBS 962.96) TaxID=1314807 RepID=A0A4S8KWM1_DENBC|nr:hypothetical protein K435DRAFT_768161 [Dendrothele bispora CBS 962.96]
MFTSSAFWQLQHRRTVASTVTNKPASQSFDQAALNIKEEAGNSAADIAKVIAGVNMTNDAVKTGKDSFLGITGTIASEVPRPVLAFGLAGGIPYIGASATTVYLAYETGLAASGIPINIDPGVALTVLDQALNVQVTYGAVMLSFLGALHWGMEFAELGGRKGYARLALGAVPVIFAWLTLALQPMTALLVQCAGFSGLWWADAKATSMGWAPKWYSQYRFYLSILVGTCIIGSLAGCSYWGPVADHGVMARVLELVKEQRKQLLDKKNVKKIEVGPVSAKAAVSGDEAYVKLTKRRKRRK